MTAALCIILCFMCAVILARLLVISDQVDDIELAQRKNATNTSTGIDWLKSDHKNLDVNFTRLDNSINRIERYLTMIRTTNLTSDNGQVVSQFLQAYNERNQYAKRNAELEVENAVLKERVRLLTKELLQNEDELEL